MSVMRTGPRPRTGWLIRRATLAALVPACALLVGSAAAALGDAPGSGGADTTGRYAVTSAAGGAVWAFEADGDLFVIGPGELIAEGAWSPGVMGGLFDAGVEVPVTGQQLAIMGAISPDGTQIALLVRASDARAPDDGVAWPALSLLHGERVSLVPEETPEGRAAPAPSPAADL